MADISKITVLDGTSYDLKDSTARKYMVLYGTGTGTTGYMTWDASMQTSVFMSAMYTVSIPAITEYYDGLTVAYKLPVDVDEYGAALRANSLAYKPIIHTHNTASNATIPNYRKDSIVLLVYCSTVSGYYFNYAPYATSVTGCWVIVNDYYVDNYYAYIRAGASNSTENAATTSGNTYLNLVENSSRRSGVRLVPGSNMTITSDASGNVTFTADNYWQYNSTTDTIDLIFPAIT